jgi:hypothetical protein
MGLEIFLREKPPLMRAREREREKERERERERAMVGWGALPENRLHWSAGQSWSLPRQLFPVWHNLY